MFTATSLRRLIATITVAALGTSIAFAAGSAARATVNTTTQYTLTQVATHNTASDCWSVVNGKVYNLTSWIAKHPGGTGPIKGMCGVDASAAFNGQHSGTSSAKNMLASFQIGVIAGASTKATTSKAKKISITCVKGAKKKVVTSTAPKCPAGYKKSSSKTVVVVVSTATSKSTIDKTNIASKVHDESDDEDEDEDEGDDD